MSRIAYIIEDVGASGTNKVTSIETCTDYPKGRTVAFVIHKEQRSDPHGIL
jgi:hypothetical protein